MILELGHFSLILAFSLAVALSIIPLVGVYRGDNLWISTAKSMAIGYCCFLFLGFICLNQSNLTPLIVLSSITLVTVLLAKRKPNNKTVYALSVLGIINAILLLFILTRTNSFLHYVSSSSLSGKNFNHPEIVNNSVIGRHFPSFSLASTADDKTVVTQHDLLGKVSVVNVWATWCASCRIEQPQLLKLAHDNKIFVVGINYKDDKKAAQKWLAELGNPYFFSIYDGDGTLGVNLGVYGAPETYIVDKHGIIRYKHVGIVSESVWENKLQAEFNKWQQAK